MGNVAFREVASSEFRGSPGRYLLTKTADFRSLGESDEDKADEKLQESRFKEVTRTSNTVLDQLSNTLK